MGTWVVIGLLWFFVLALLITSCTRAPLASYRDPRTGQLCWGRVDAEELRCTTR